MDRKLEVTILYDALEDREQAAAIERGEHPAPLVWEQLTKVLTERGHEVKRLAASGTVSELAAQLQKDDSDVIFNVSESFGGNDQQDHNVAALLELCGKRFTGAGSIGLALAGDKALAKKLLSFHGINTPRFSVMQAGEVDHADDLTFPMFVKPSNSDASIGIDDRSVVHNFKELMERISYIQTEFNLPALIEEFIDGREMYVSVLGGARPEALPIIEWDFSKVPEGTERIASAEAKWNANSERFRDCPEVIPTDLPEPVVKMLQEAAVNAFKSLRLRDYGRIDMRVRRKADAKTAGGTDPRDAWDFFLIEVNPNPHLDGASELPLAAKGHGLSYGDLIERILENALSRSL